MRRAFWIGSAVLLATLGTKAVPGCDEPSASDPAQARARALFRQSVEPMLRVKCLGCHGDGEELDAELDLRNREAMLRGGKNGPALVPGNARASFIYQAVIRSDERVMPPKERERLAPAEIAALKTWIEAGGTVGPRARGHGEAVKPMRIEPCRGCHAARSAVSSLPRFDVQVRTVL